MERNQCCPSVQEEHTEAKIVSAKPDHCAEQEQAWWKSVKYPDPPRESER